MSNHSPVQTPEVVKQRNYGFQPGVSGNPDGRPPVPKCITDQLRAIALNDQKPNASSLALALWTKGEAGDTFAIKEILDRVEGKVPNPIDLTAKVLNIEIAGQYAELLLSALDVIRLNKGNNQAQGVIVEGVVKEKPASMGQTSDSEHDNSLVNDNGHTDATQ